MMLNPLHALRSLFARPEVTLQQAAVAQGGVVVVPPDVPLFDGAPIPRYPDTGIAAPAAPPEMLMASQQKMIDDLHQASSFSYAEFNHLILPAIRNYAAYVHLLPASETNHHCGQGGLFRHGLEVAFNAALACESKVFAMDHWASQRDKLVPRWRMCAILGGMIHDMGKPIIDVGAIDESGKHMWNPHNGSLWDWLQEHALPRYYIHWRSGARHKRHEAFNAVAMYRIIPDDTMRWISEFGGQEPLDFLVMSLTGSSDPRNPLASIIKQADSKSVDRDIRDSRARLTASGQGGRRSLAARLVRAMHDLIEGGTWDVNKIGSPVWVTTEGVFGMYPAVIQKAIEVLREQGDTALPHDSASVLDLLADWGYLHPNVFPNGQTTSTWNIRITGSDRGKEVIIDAHVVRFTKEEMIPSTILPPTPAPAEVMGHDGRPLSLGSITPAPTAAKASATAAGRPGAPADAAEIHLHRREDGAASADSLMFGEADGLLVDDMIEGAPSEFGEDPRADLEDITLRDRSTEEDPRDAATREARRNYNATFPPTTPEGAHAWLTAKPQQPEGEFLLQIAMGVCNDTLREGTHVFDENGHIHLRSPDAFKGLGYEPAELRGHLEAKGWTETDNPTGSRTTVSLEVRGKKVPCTRLTESMSAVFRLLLPARKAQGAPAPVKAQRKLPMGPYIDAEAADRIQDRNRVVEQDGLMLRPLVFRYLQDKAREMGTTFQLLGDEQTQLLFREFAKQHGIKATRWLLSHLVSGAPALFVAINPAIDASGTDNVEFKINSDYEPSTDMQRQTEAVA